MVGTLKNRHVKE